MFKSHHSLISYGVIILGSFAFGIVALLSCIAIAQVPWPGYENPDYGECNPGWVWRDAYHGDHTCVVPASRTRAAQDNQQSPSRKVPTVGDVCRTGYVWREAFPGDHVCVEPTSRDVAAAQNAEQHNRITAARSGPNGPFLCKSGFVWRLASPTDFICVTPDERTTAARQNSWAAERKGSDACQSGWVWREAKMTDLVCVSGQVRAETKKENADAALNALSPSCEMYGKQAIAQVQQAQQKNCQVSGPRWTPVLANHVNWCMVERPTVAFRQKEMAARSQTLANCGPSAATPVVNAQLQLLPGTFNLMLIGGSGFTPNSTATLTVSTKTNGGPATNIQTIPVFVGALGQFSTSVGKECPLGKSTVHSVIGVDMSGKSSNTAGISC